jgi:hypothetical protein
MDPNAPPSSTTEANDGIVALYPNPAGDEVNVQLSAAAGKPLAVGLLDVQGRRLSTAFTTLSDGTLRLATSAAVPGLYLVQVQTTGGVFARKVVIE